MPPSYVTEQTWAYRCHHCGHRWTATFEARHTESAAGTDYCVWIRNGIPSAAPTARLACPRCASAHTTGVQSGAETSREYYQMIDVTGQ